ncbi:NCS2 family permease [Micromonospora tulbaghiae]|uniref:MFS transporter, AGZA family, xanthine/uracil permease n=1 Tax=Micromonospora tulbaghiae TaxID=479978 RepID=A0AAW4JQD3_9ACTN|nr:MULTISPECIES: NCS2 family permease [Micromonospora]KAB1904618.1 NCS2 family permease [Micromonospora sp. AMSO1212t]MBO4143570.1 NCS2 family permease [Micromonospora tulbaghiae]MDX5456502.1 NCS2 family permease [Micromonospora tulbaghiae]SCE67873.1 putative MFS transporter, AGZA family, xanthine/uracil permease [Micromonospora tulbaghiae]
MSIAPPPDHGTPPDPAHPRNAFDRFFLISERGSTLSRELRGGFATFFTMAYIVVLNPLILGSGKDGDGRSLAIPALAAATALVAGLMTILMGVVARFPIALAAGLGVNALVAYEIAPQMTWADAMGLVVIEGVLIGILVLTGLRTAVFRSVPTQLKTAIGVGIGLFLTIIGLVDAGFVRRVPDAANSTVPVGLGINGKIVSWPMLVFVVGLLITLVLVVRRVRGAILIGILASTVLAIVVEAIANVGPSFVDGKPNPKGWALNVPELPKQIVDLPDLSLLGQFNVLNSWSRVGWLVPLMFIFTLLITDFFDTMGTMVAIGQEGDMLDETGTPPKAKEILLVDSIAAAAGGAASVSSNTSYIESAAGVAEGARTGVANLVTGALFLLAMFLAPLSLIVPFEAASTALVVVGFLMMTAVRTIDWTDYEIAIPAFLTIALMPFTYSISNGIGAGVISFVLLKVAKGKAREVHPLLYGVAVLFIVYFLRGPVESVLL